MALGNVTSINLEIELDSMYPKLEIRHFADYGYIKFDQEVIKTEIHKQHVLATYRYHKKKTKESQDEVINRMMDTVLKVLDTKLINMAKLKQQVKAIRNAQG